MTRRISPTSRRAHGHSAFIGVLVSFGASGPLIDFPGNPQDTPILARSTVALEATDEGRELAVMFEFGDPLRPLIIGVIQDGLGRHQKASVWLSIGLVSTVREDGRVEVRTNDGVISCSLLDKGVGAQQYAGGDSVLVIGIPTRPPCIIGAIRDSSGVGRREVKAEKVIFDAGEELVLKTKRSCLILRSNGDVEIHGERIVSRARNLMKLMAPTIKLN